MFDKGSKQLVTTGINYTIPVFVYDETNGIPVRVQWNKKKQFHNVEFEGQNDVASVTLGVHGRIRELLEKCSSELAKFLNKKIKCRSAICYFDLCGSKAFAGNWDNYDSLDNHRLVLLDIEIPKEGFVSQHDYLHFPSQAITTVQTPTLIVYGIVDEKFEAEVRSGKYGSFGSVVCKSDEKDNHDRRITFRIKRQKVKESKENSSTE